MSGPLRESITHLDFAIACQIKGCALRATHFIEWHMAQKCSHPSLNSAGNIERWLCDIHTRKAAEDAQRCAHPPWWARWFKPESNTCRTCGRTLQLAGDLLQIVLPL